jgi:hypothetical protein
MFTFFGMYLPVFLSVSGFFFRRPDASRINAYGTKYGTGMPALVMVKVSI